MPPSQKGWHLNMRQNPCNEPLNAPCFLIDSIVYVEQVGENRHPEFGTKCIIGDNIFL